jgi:hypothetical protein
MHEEERWLLVKIRDEKADARRNPVSSEPNSAVTGRSLEEIAKQEGAPSWRNPALKAELRTAELYGHAQIRTVHR